MSENTATYTARWGADHNFSAMVGFSASQKIVHSLTVDANGILDDSLKWNNLNAVSTKEGYTNSSYYQKVVRESVLTRINYNWRNVHFLTFTAVTKSEVPTLLPKLQSLGATDIVEYELRKVML